MYCKNCGNKIENDSKFCSFCGCKIDPILQTTPTQQPIVIDPVTYPSIGTVIENNKSEGNSDKGLLIAFAVMAGLRLFWFIVDLVNEGKSYEDLETFINFVLKPSYILFWCVPLILALYSKRKEQRIILLLISLVIIGWNIYENFIKTV